jgi:hypothetical protein
MSAAAGLRGGDHPLQARDAAQVLLLLDDDLLLDVLRRGPRPLVLTVTMRASRSGIICTGT